MRKRGSEGFGSSPWGELVPFDVQDEEEGKRMNWKRTARWSWLILPFLLLAVGPGVAAAHHGHKPASLPCVHLQPGQACFYEVTEEATYDTVDLSAFGLGIVPSVRHSTSSNMGRVVGIFPGCELRCDVIAVAADSISLLPAILSPTGVAAGLGVQLTPLELANCPGVPSGPSICASFVIVVNEPGGIDPSEVVVAGGVFWGQVDISPAVAGPNGVPQDGDEIPLGSITNGQWMASGFLPNGTPWARSGTLTGIFRMPFTNKGAVKNFMKKKFNLPDEDDLPAFYLVDFKKVPVRENERSLGFPLLRIEIEFVAGP